MKTHKPIKPIYILLHLKFIKTSSLWVLATLAIRLKPKMDKLSAMAKEKNDIRALDRAPLAEMEAQFQLVKLTAIVIMEEVSATI